MKKRKRSALYCTVTAVLFFYNSQGWAACDTNAVPLAEYAKAQKLSKEKTEMIASVMRSGLLSREDFSIADTAVALGYKASYRGETAARLIFLSHLMVDRRDGARLREDAAADLPYVYTLVETDIAHVDLLAQKASAPELKSQLSQLKGALGLLNMPFSACR